MTDPNRPDPALPPSLWPPLPLVDWQDTYTTLHIWAKIVGKIRYAFSPVMNHWWQVPFYVTTRGLTTSPIPYGPRTFEIDFDFLDHKLIVQTSEGDTRTLALEPRFVADFYNDLMVTLGTLGIRVTIFDQPGTIPASEIAYAQDTVHAAYDAEAVGRWWQVIRLSDMVFKEFRARYTGKASPVQLFYGSFDLAFQRFSGRRAPKQARPETAGSDEDIAEEISAGFWPGSGTVQAAAYYCYASPEPQGFSTYPVKPASAFYSKDFGEYILLYDDVRTSPDPRQTLLDFLQTTYEAGASLGKWEREALER